jgi:histidyl-tRNA synthetase
VSGPRAPKGTYDLLPLEADRRDLIVAVAADVFTSYGYRHIVTPEFEDTGLFERGVGDATDIVRKEMYTFSDRGDRSLTLRPEGTAPICRAYVEHGMHKLPQPAKLWYYAPMFRYERPQAGRFRQHYQLGAEAIGSALPAVDVEVIAMLATLYDELEIGDLTLSVNSIGDAACRPAYVERLRDFLAARAGDLCGECRERTVLNPLRTFDCKVDSCRAVLDEAPRLVDHLCPDCDAHHRSVVGLLERLGLDPRPDFRLVRGLDYYTRTTFEFSSGDLGAQSGVGGGGRYDGLVELLGGPVTPGVGFGTGLERITLVSRLDDDPLPGAMTYVVCFDEARRGDAFVLTERLRRELFIDAECDLAGRSAKGQLRQATRSGAELAVLVGLPGLGAEVVRVRDLATGHEADVSLPNLEDWVDDWLAHEELAAEIDEAGGNGNRLADDNGNRLADDGSDDE